MLTLGRKPGEYVVIGDDIVVMVVDDGSLVRISIDAPKDMNIVRGEIYEKDHPTPSCVERKRNY